MWILFLSIFSIAVAEPSLNCPVGTELKKIKQEDGGYELSCNPKNKKANLITPRKSFYSDGRLAEEGQMKGLVRFGEWSFFEKDGKLKEKKQYDESGEEACPDGPAVKNEDLIFSYKKGQVIYPLAIWRDGKFVSAREQSIRGRDKWSGVGGKVSIDVETNKPSRDVHSDWCIHSARIKNSPKVVKDFDLFYSGNADVKVPSQKDLDLFKKLNPKCVNHGDFEPPKCLFPELKAVSDLNRNGRPEFWYQTPYLWDLGMAVSEISEDGSRLNSIAEDCSDCSD